MNNKIIYKISISIIFFSFAIFFFSIQSELENLNITNIVFVDGVIWYEFIENILVGNQGFFNIRSSWILFLIFLPTVYLWGYFGPILLNSFLFGFFICKKQDNLLISLVIFLPFFFISSLLPGKEILSLIISYYFIKFLIKDDYKRAIFFAILQLLIRDGSGIIFVLFLFLKWIGALNIKSILLIILICLFLDNFIIELQAYLNLFILERTIGFYDDKGDWQPYLIRVFANATGLSTRAVFFSNDDYLSLTGVSLFLSGIGVTASITLSLYKILFKSRDDNLVIVSYWVIIFLLMSSISPLIQPRYLIPISCSYILLWKNFDDNKIFYLAIIFSIIFNLFIRFLYIFIMGFNLPDVDNFFINLN